jgi:hypothetical protein
LRIAARKLGFFSTPSARALTSRLPIDGSSAHDGTRPHLSARKVRCPSRRPTASTGVPGATL